jgi:hypothetical protein
MQPDLSVIALTSEARLMTPFLESLIGPYADMEVILAGRPDSLESSLADRLDECGITLRFMEPDDSAAGYGYADWALAIKNARADFVWHVDPLTRLVSRDRLQHNLSVLRASQADILHFNMRYANRPALDSPHAQGILEFALQQNISAIEVINKIYARSLCRNALSKLQGIHSGCRPLPVIMLHLTLAALAGSYVSKARDMAEHAFIPYTLQQNAQSAAELYAALAQLPDCFIRWGYSETVTAFARYRFRAELALALGRTQRAPQENAAVSGADVAQALHESFVDEKALLNALVIGVAVNAAKCSAIYHTVYADTVFDPCPAYSLEKITITDLEPGQKGGR